MPSVVEIEDPVEESCHVEDDHEKVGHLGRDLVGELGLVGMVMVVLVVVVGWLLGEVESFVVEVDLVEVEVVESKNLSDDFLEGRLREGHLLLDLLIEVVIFHKFCKIIDGH